MNFKNKKFISSNTKNSYITKSNSIISLIISLLFLYLAFRNVDFKQIPKSFQNLNIKYLILIIFSLLSENILRTYRWQKIISQTNIGFTSVFKALILGSFINNLFPARMGDFYKAYYLGQMCRTSSAKLLASVVLERFTDGIIIILLILFSIYFFSLGSEFRHAGTVVTFFYLLVFVLIFFTIKFPKQFEKLTVIMFSIFPQVIRNKAQTIANSFREGFEIVADLNKFFIVTFLSFLAWANSTITYYLYFKLFNLSISFAGAILLISIISIGAMLPTVPGLIGIYQWCCMLVLHNILNESNNVAATFSIVTHFISYIFSITTGFYILYSEKILLNQIINFQNTKN